MFVRFLSRRLAALGLMICLGFLASTCLADMPLPGLDIPAPPSMAKPTPTPRPTFAANVDPTEHDASPLCSAKRPTDLPFNLLADQPEATLDSAVLKPYLVQADFFDSHPRIGGQWPAVEGRYWDIQEYYDKSGDHAAKSMQAWSNVCFAVGWMGVVIGSVAIGTGAMNFNNTSGAIATGAAMALPLSAVLAYYLSPQLKVSAADHFNNYLQAKKDSIYGVPKPAFAMPMQSAPGLPSLSPSSPAPATTGTSNNNSGGYNERPKDYDPWAE